jgi:hypothetical protein
MKQTIFPLYNRKNSVFTGSFSRAFIHWIADICVYTAYFLTLYHILWVVEYYVPSIQYLGWIVAFISLFILYTIPLHWYDDPPKRWSLIITSFGIILYSIYYIDNPLLILFILIYQTIIVIYRIFISYRIPRHYLTGFSIKSVLTILILLCTSLLYIYLTSFYIKLRLNQGGQFFIIVSSLLALFVFTQPFRMGSVIRTAQRYIFRSIRHDLLQERNSPMLGITHWFNRLFRQTIPSVFSLKNRKFFFGLSIIIGYVLIPFLIYTETGPTGFWELMWMGVLSTVGLMVTYTIIYFLITRQKYVVIPFQITEEVSNGQAIGSPELRAVSNLATNLLVDELQKISVLLKMRQVESLSISQNNGNAFFVTSGMNQDFLNHMQELISLNIPPGNFNLGGMVAFVIRQLAHIQVGGRVQKRSNGNIELWVQLNYGNNRSASVGQVILPENSISDIDGIMLRPVVRNIAIKLFLEMGYIQHLGTTTHGLDNFLHGLEATAKRDWWRAISHYREAVLSEEAEQGKFGIGYYHLGTALIFQGSWRQGLEHLLKSEEDGPNIAETQYMIALTKLYMYWANIHEYPNIFYEIKQRLKRAIHLKPDFPEAYQMLGTAFYHRARLMEITHSRTEDKDHDSFPYYYRQSAYYLRRAIQQYNKRHYHNPDTPIHFSAQQNQNTSSAAQQILTFHELGDALRGMKYYIEAETYYQDVMTIMPHNVRNLANLIKIYCLQENWQKAEETILREAFQTNKAYWDADISFHMAWLMFGGAKTKRFGQELIRNYNHYRLKDNSLTNEENYIAEGFKYLDYAIQQRPRYLTFWDQTNWLKPLLEKVDIKFPYRKKIFLKHMSDNLLLDTYQNRILQMSIWIGMRLDSNYLADSSNLIFSGKYSYIQTRLLTISTYFLEANKTLYGYQEKLRNAKDQVFQYLQKMELSIRATGLIKTYQRLIIADELYKYWEDVSNGYRDMTSGDTITLQERWYIDIYCEISLLTARMLAEAGAYEILFYVSNQTLSDLQQWLRRWNQKVKHNRTPNFNFAPRVNQFHQATLLAWRAYALINCYYHRETRSRYESGIIDPKFSEAINGFLEPNSNNISQLTAYKTIIFIKTQEDITLAQTKHSSHPLVIFVQALIYQKRELYGESIDQYQRLIDLISPLDYRQKIKIEKRPDDGLANINPLPTPITDQRIIMTYMEAVSGRQQFNGIVNLTTVNMEIASIQERLENPELRVTHLLEAIRESRFDDLNLDNLIRLANQLSHLERYDEALAILDAADWPNKKLGQNQLSYTKPDVITVLRATIESRAGKGYKALECAKSVAYSFKLEVDIPTIENLNNLNDPLWQLDNGISYKEDFVALYNYAFYMIRKQKNEKTKSSIKYVRNSFFISKKSLRFILKKRRINPPLKRDRSLFRTLNNLQKHYPAPTHLKIISEESQFIAIFSKLRKDSEKLSRLATYVGVSINKEERNKAFTALKSQASKLSEMSQLVMLSHMMTHVSREYSNKVSLMAELCNTLAYNRAQMNLLITHAYNDSLVATGLMLYLLKMSDRELRAHSGFRAKVAQYYDTFGWTRYCYYNSHSATLRTKNIDGTVEKTLTDLEDTITTAEEFIERGIRYDPDRAILHYHLSEIYLAKIELLWQKSPNIGHNHEDLAKVAKDINSLIEEARQHLLIARQNDKFGHLHAQIGGLADRVRIYHNAWRQRQYDGIAGRQMPHTDL